MTMDNFMVTLKVIRQLLVLFLGNYFVCFVPLILQKYPLSTQCNIDTVNGSSHLKEK